MQYIKSDVEKLPYLQALHKMQELYDAQIKVGHSTKPLHIPPNLETMDACQLKELLLTATSLFMQHDLHASGIDFDKGLHQIVHPVLVEDPDLLLAWVTRSSRYVETIMEEPAFRNHIHNAEFAKRLLQNDMFIFFNELWTEVALMHPQFLHEEWLAHAAFSSHRNADFIHQHLSVFLNDKDFFIKTCQKNGYRTQLDLFKNLLQDTDALFEALKDNPYMNNLLDRQMPNYSKLVERLVHYNPKWMLQHVIPAQHRLQPQMLAILEKNPVHERASYFDGIPAHLLQDPSKWKIFCQHVNGWEAVNIMAHKALENHSWLAQHDELIATTFQAISQKIAAVTGNAYIEEMGGAVYGKHPVQEWLAQQAQSNRLVAQFSMLDSGKLFFQKSRDKTQFIAYDDSLAKLWEAFKPLYDSSVLEHALPAAEHERKPAKL